MPQIIPIKELKNIAQISNMCSQTKEPIYITKNGYGAMVIMDVAVYEEKMAMLDVYAKLALAENQIREDNVLDADKNLQALRNKYNV